MEFLKRNLSLKLKEEKIYITSYTPTIWRKLIHELIHLFIQVNMQVS